MHFWKFWKKRVTCRETPNLAVAEDAEAVLKLQKNMEESVGTYLEDYFENVSEIKKNCLSDTRDALSGAGKQNGNPVYPLCGRSGPKACRDKRYYVWKRGEAEGMFDSQIGALSFFTQNLEGRIHTDTCGRSGCAFVCTA